MARKNRNSRASVATTRPPSSLGPSPLPESPNIGRTPSPLPLHVPASPSHAEERSEKDVTVVDVYAPSTVHDQSRRETWATHETEGLVDDPFQIKPSESVSNVGGPTQMHHSRWQEDSEGWRAGGRGMPGSMGGQVPETWRGGETEEEEIVEEHHAVHEESDPDDLYAHSPRPPSDAGTWPRPQSASSVAPPVLPPGGAGASPPRSSDSDHHPPITPSRVRFDRFARSPRPNFQSIQHSSAAAPPSPQSPSEVPRVIHSKKAPMAMPTPTPIRPTASDPPSGAWRTWAVEAAKLPKSALPGAPPPPSLAAAAAQMRARQAAPQPRAPPAPAGYGPSLGRAPTNQTGVRGWGAAAQRVGGGADEWGRRGGGGGGGHGGGYDHGDDEEEYESEEEWEEEYESPSQGTLRFQGGHHTGAGRPSVPRSTLPTGTTSKTMAYARGVPPVSAPPLLGGPSLSQFNAPTPTSTRSSRAIPSSPSRKFRRIVDAQGDSLVPAQAALYSRARPPQERLHWDLNPRKDPRVRHTLEGIRTLQYDIGRLGLLKFLETGARGALFVNADHVEPEPTDLAVDWVPYHQMQHTLDRTLQQCAGVYDPAEEVIVFPFLLSKSGNSMAIWRERIPVSRDLKVAYAGDLAHAKTGLREEAAHVDHLSEHVPAPAPASVPVIVKPTSVVATKEIPISTLEKPKKKKKGFFKRLFCM